MTVRDIKPEARPASRIPTFANYEEERSFWDTHDFTDYLDELTPSTLRYVGEPMEQVTVTIDPETMKRIRAESKQEGIDPAVLLHIYALEHFQREDHTETPWKKAAPETPAKAD